MSLIPSSDLPSLSIGGGANQKQASMPDVDISDIISYANQPGAIKPSGGKPAGPMVTSGASDHLDRRIADIDDALSGNLPKRVESDLKEERASLEGERQIRSRSESALERISEMRASGQNIELARAETRDTPNGTMIDIVPEDDLMKGLPKVTVPNNVGADGFGRDIWQHDYLVVTDAPSDLKGPEALKGVGEALRKNPAPGESRPASPDGTLNDVGGIVYFDGGDNMVRSYVIKSDDPNRSDIVVNYTVDGEHALDEGFVMRFAEMAPDGSIQLVTYGEGNAAAQVEALEGPVWGELVDKTWTENANEIFEDAQAATR